MKRNKYLFVFYMLLAITLAGGIFTRIYMSLEEQTAEDGKLGAVTSFYPIYIAAVNIVGDSDGVWLENLSEPQTGCLHDYQLTPQDMILLSKADLFLVNGGGIEGFLTEAGENCPALKVKEATEGVELLEEYGSGFHPEEHSAQEEIHIQEDHIHGTENAHGWMDTGRYLQMVRNMADAISQMDQEHARLYQEHADSYCAKVTGLTERITGLRQKLEEKGKAAGGTEKGNSSSESLNVIIFHEAFAYVAEELGLKVVYCLNLDEERQVSAGELADLLEAIQEHQVSVILAEEQYGRKLGETVESETDCQVYYLDTLVRGGYEKDSYLEAMEKNIEVLEQADW